MKLSIHRAVIYSVILIGVRVSANGQMTPQEAIAKMTPGINLGRCMDMPHEGDAQTIQEYYFDDFTNAGFNFVRVPTQRDHHRQFPS